ncbi:MAG TPA: hypothetical protein VI356_12860 [Myxococcales bacterium]
MRDLRLKKVLFLLFVLSGFCSLLYQVVWVRLAFAAFGVITPILSVVISVFMFGLFVGSWGAGKLVGRLTARTRLSAAWLYAAAELVIGLSAFAVPRLFTLGESWLLQAGEANSFAYLAWSGVILASAIFPWCVFMGATFPLMMAFVKEQDEGESKSFSFLYLANVIGAMAGALTTALVLVELLGFRNTLHVAAAVNILIAVVAGTLAFTHPLGAGRATAPGSAPAPATGPDALSRRDARLAMIILFTSGFTSMAMEVAWTRAFTPVLETQVYSFAALLSCYLLATWFGSLRYRRNLAEGRVAPTSRLLAWLSIGAILPLVVNDPRTFTLLEHLLGHGTAMVLRIVAALVSILPFCAILGYLTPKLVDGYSGGRPEGAGSSYAINVLGCILGPLFASYLLLPLLGVKYTLLVLAAPYVLLLAAHPRQLTGIRFQRVAYPAVALMLVSLLVVKTYEERVQGFRGDGWLRRDHTATTIAFGKGMEKRLLVNGIGITQLTTITKMMAHLPLAIVREPKSALVICFGMGTTFRSLMSWDVQVTAVELVPGVKDVFPYFFSDGAELLGRPNGQVVIDDGRRFLQRSDRMYDVITLDPPPPVEAAASSLLYSEEFYAAAKARLRPGGVLQQWVPPADPCTTEAVARSLLRSFKFVRMFTSYEGWGHHFLASMQPIEIPPAAALARRLPATARRDLLEWTQSKDPAQPLAVVLRQERDPRELANCGDARITDDQPYNEYYVLRSTWSAAASLFARPRADGRTARE